MMVGIGSTKTSVAKYWVGFGVLEKDDKGYYERVLTPVQYETLKNRPHRVVQNKLVELRNFKEIWVYPRIHI
jgi:hypothetical protein